MVQQEKSQCYVSPEIDPFLAPAITLYTVYTVASLKLSTPLGKSFVTLTICTLEVSRGEVIDYYDVIITYIVRSAEKYFPSKPLY